MGIRFFLTLTLCVLLQTVGHAQEAHRKVRLGVIADPQYADKESKGSRFYRNSLLKLDTATSVINDQEVDFTVVLGDLVDAGMKDILPVQQRLATLKQPVYNILGNHDFVDVEDGSTLYKQFAMPSSYYIIEKDQWIFILLNTNELSEYATKEGSSQREEWKKMNDQIMVAKRENAQPWNGGIGSKQLQWMEKQIQKANRKSKQVIIFTHHPLFPENGLEALNNREILSIIEKYSNVRAVISGHHHEGNFGVYKNIPMVTLEGMVETEAKNSYGIIELYANKLVIKGYGRMTTRTFEF
jgi:3',5'-cyclic AMP phosphodiesterase CpdA